MRSPALWLYLLGAVTFLVIALRRLRQRLTPLNDEVYSKQVAVDHVHSGVSWVRSDGQIGWANPALAKTVKAIPAELVGTRWTALFPEKLLPRIEQAYSEALLSGKASFQSEAQCMDGSHAQVGILLVCVHDHRSRFVGHYCLMEDQTRIAELEQELRKFSGRQAVGR